MIKVTKCYPKDENRTECKEKYTFKIIGNLDEGKGKQLNEDIYKRIVSKNSCWSTEHI